MRNTWDQEILVVWMIRSKGYRKEQMYEHI